MINLYYLEESWLFFFLSFFLATGTISPESLDFFKVVMRNSNFSAFQFFFNFWPSELLILIKSEWTLRTIRSHGMELIVVERKLRVVTSKTKELVPVQPDLPLFWKSHCLTCVPA